MSNEDSYYKDLTKILDSVPKGIIIYDDLYSLNLKTNIFPNYLQEFLNGNYKSNNYEAVISSNKYKSLISVFSGLIDNSGQIVKIENKDEIAKAIFGKVSANYTLILTSLELRREIQEKESKKLRFIIESEDLSGYKSTIYGYYLQSENSLKILQFKNDLIYNPKERVLSRYIQALSIFGLLSTIAVLAENEKKPVKLEFEASQRNFLDWMIAISQALNVPLKDSKDSKGYYLIFTLKDLI
ncbi:MAG: hypothetical protein OH318_01705 [Candidatus Parvarchaeota archaeon]|nr:hypothetical protein [Candidatus Rehaiarchaeum fermentans]MCW1293088.1 hypothetical protein [Candidatus Rehaiarchaeum fermentans]MCW1293453.1 hypothetical protein [Candidatus Rehaiarchaeum fermentans]